MPASFLDGDVIERINYYTAPVSGKTDPSQPVRQQAYLRALKTLPSVSTFMGTFLQRKVPRPLVTDLPLLYPKESPHIVLVRDTEEKGSDVNLASHLVRDGMLHLFEMAGVISADTDLVEPIRIVVNEVKLPVVIISQEISRSLGPTLQHAATSVRHITKSDLAASQFPDVIAVPGKPPIRRPSAWV